MKDCRGFESQQEFFTQRDELVDGAMLPIMSDVIIHASSEDATYSIPLHSCSLAGRNKGALLLRGRQRFYDENHQYQLLQVPSEVISSITSQVRASEIMGCMY